MTTFHHYFTVEGGKEQKGRYGERGLEKEGGKEKERQKEETDDGTGRDTARGGGSELPIYISVLLKLNQHHNELECF